LEEIPGGEIMGNTITLSETFVIALGCMAAVFAIIVLCSISLVAKLSRMTAESQQENKVEQNTVQGFASSAVVQKPVQSFDDSIDEEDKLVVALAASIAAAKDKPDSYFHISKITRVR
jgi:hypothetical protein